MTENRRRKKKEERRRKKKPQDENIVSASATQGGHNQFARCSCYKSVSYLYTKITTTTTATTTTTTTTTTTVLRPLYRTTSRLPQLRIGGFAKFYCPHFHVLTATDAFG